MEITVGMKQTCEVTVDTGNTARAVGSGTLDVYATPMMIALMENSAASCIQPALGNGRTSVGTAVDIKHVSATPVGMKVTATAVVTGVDGDRVDFEITASDEAGVIGSGSHTRFIVEEERFLNRTNRKLQK